MTTHIDYSLKTCDDVKHNHEPPHVVVPPTIVDPIDVPIPVDMSTSANHSDPPTTVDPIDVPIPVDMPTPVNHSDDLPIVDVDSRVKFYTTVNKKIGIIYDGYKFTQKQTHCKTTIHFRCQSSSSKKCPAKLTTYNDFSVKNIDDANSTKHNHTPPLIENIDNSDTDSRVNSDPLTSDSEPNINTNVSSGNACLDTCPIANDRTHFISAQNEEGLIYKGYRFLKKPSKAKKNHMFISL